MSSEPPTSPANLPTETVSTLRELTPERLRDAVTYAEAIAKHKERKPWLEEESDDADTDHRLDNLPNDVPTKATITIKEINDNRYYYWQWREGGKIKSEYKSPVNPDE